MRRTQIQVDEPTYEALRHRAFERGISIAALVREILHESLGTKGVKRFRVKDLHFIGIGSGEPTEYDPISERHDEFLGDELYRDILEKSGRTPTE